MTLEEKIARVIDPQAFDPESGIYINSAGVHLVESRRSDQQSTLQKAKAILSLLPNTGEREKALEETVWMIEWPQDDNMPARWWHPQNGWMLDASKAVRFSRRQDAEAYRWIMRVAGTKVTEHKFIGNLHSRALKSTPAPVGEDVVERAKKEILHAINNHKTIVCQEDTWRDQSNEALALSVYRHLASANLLRKE